MLYEFLKIMLLVFGPVLIYSVLRITFQMPELIATLPAVVRRAIEATGAALVVAAWFVADMAPFGGALAFIGLILLLTPFAASKLSQPDTAYVEA